MLKRWLKRALQIVGTLALVALVVIVCRRTDWSKGFSPDGDLTLVAGAIAFVAVIFQIRSSSKRVQNQIEAQHRAQKEEQDRQKRVVASGILFEIDGLYRWLLRDVRDFLRDVDPEKEDLTWLEAKAVPTSQFAVFAANAGRIGELDEPIVENAVRFYMSVQAISYGIERYDEARRRYLAARSHEGEDIRRRLLENFMGNVEFEDPARQWLGNVKRGLPPLVLIAYNVCQQLCAVLSISFEAPRIAVAAEDMHAVRQEIIKAGGGTIFEHGE
jgi:hypothetical protein